MASKERLFIVLPGSRRLTCSREAVAREYLENCLSSVGSCVSLFYFLQ